MLNLVVHKETARLQRLILFSHLRLGLPNGLFPSGFPTTILYTPLLSRIRATFPTHPIPLDFITRTIFGQQYRSFSSSLCSFLHSPVTPSLLGPNSLLNTLFSNTLSLCSSCNVNDQVPQPYKTTQLLILILIQDCSFIGLNKCTQDVHSITVFHYSCMFCI